LALAPLAPLISLIPGVNVGFWTIVGVGVIVGVGGGAVAGGALGAGAAAVTHATYPASILVIPSELSRAQELGCKTLGNNYENPFKEEII
ncbi:MAG: hypothetical protein KJ922_02320, partial [Nanoarchaeota archaeon]|nr:hypothetical protein [Nanoarchaeota archaeon]